MDYERLTDIPADVMAQIEAINPNLRKIIALIETFPTNGEYYFYFRNFVGDYIRAMGEKEGLRKKLRECEGEA